MAKSKLDRTIENLSILKNRIKGCYNSAMLWHWDWDRLHQSVLSYMETDDYKKLPRWAQSELRGYQRAMSECFRESLEERWELNGKQYVRGPEREKAFEGRWSEVKYMGMYYPGTDIRYVSQSELDIYDKQ